MTDNIRNWGWQMDESNWTARRRVKKYSFPILLTNQDLLTEGEKKWFAKRKKYHMPSCSLQDSF